MNPNSSLIPGRSTERPSVVLHLAAVAAAVAALGLLVVLAQPGTQTAGLGNTLLAGLPGQIAGATAAGMTLFVAAYLTRIRDARPALARAAWAAAVLAFASAGWAAMEFRVPRELVPLQNGAGVAFFLSLLYVAVGTSPRAVVQDRAPVNPGVRRWVLVAGVVMVFQMVLGALVRFAAATGGVVFGSEQATGLVHDLHRVGSLAAVCLVAGSALAMVAATRERPGLRGLAGAVVLLVLAQALVGAQSVAEALPLTSVQAHIGLGVALLATHWGLYLGSAPARSGANVSLRALGREIVALTKPRISAMVIATFGGGLWLAPQSQETWKGLVALLGTLLIVGAANALNMYLERDIDGRMKRTRNRPLPQGRLSADAAVATGTALLCTSLPLMLLGGNALTCILGFVAFASYVFLYTPLKQKSSLALFVGAVPGALPPLMGWTTATGRMDAPGLVLFGILFLWQIPHFLAISVFRAEEYSRAGFKVMPAEQGMRQTRAWALACAVAMVLVSLALRPLGVSGWMYTSAAALLGAGFVVWTAAGYRLANREGAGAARWGRSLFGASILYLMLLFTALAVDHLL